MLFFREEEDARRTFECLTQAAEEYSHLPQRPFIYGFSEEERTPLLMLEYMWVKCPLRADTPVYSWTSFV